MAAVIGSLRADLSASVAQFEDDMGKASKAVEAFGKRAANVSKSLTDVGARMTLAITAPFLALAVTSAKAAAVSRDAIAQVESRLESMGAASGKTSEQLQESAKSLQRLSTYDDDVILRNVTSAMLTFGKVSGEQFDRAQRAAVDMATSLQMQLQPAAVMIGKAMNDPVKGITAMGRAGIQFTDSQKAMIKGFVESGRIMDAQNIILAELERQFMGAGKAARDAVPGSDAIDSWREFQEVLGDLALNVIEKIEPLLVRLLDSFNNMAPGMQSMIVAVAAVAAAIGPLLFVIGSLAGAVANLAPVWAGLVNIFADAAAAAGIANLGLALRALVGYLAPFAGAILFAVAAFWEFRGAFVEAFGYVAEHFQSTVLPALQKLWGALQDLFANLDKLMTEGPLGELVTFVAWAVAELSALFLEGLGHAIVMVVGTMVDLLGTAIQAVSDLVSIVADLLSGDFAGAWEGAQDLVVGVVTGILDAFENIIPGITAAATAAFEAVQTWIGEGISNVISWVSAQFPGLVDALASAATGAIAWAKNLYEGIKTWIADNLGPVIAWAKDRIRELNNLFGLIKARQAAVRGGGAAEAPAAPPPTRRPAGGAPAPAGGGSGGGGGGGKKGGKSDAEKEAEKIAKATAKFSEALDDVQANIDRAFDRTKLPRSMQAAKELRRRIADLEEEAKAAGVSTGAFADEIAKLQLQIGELETKGLQKEAADFARDVRDMAAAVTDLGGGLPPLGEELRDLDDRYADLRTSIQEQIEENAALAGANEDAAAAMAVLERQLSALDAAHAKATEAAKAQFAAEERLADLQTSARNTDTARSIQDLRERRGEGGGVSKGMRELQAIERELADQRMQAAQELASLEAEKVRAEASNNQAELARINSQIALQSQLFDLVTATSAAQIQAAERLKQAFDSFVDGLSTELTDMVMDWEFDLDGLRDVFKQLARDLFIKPVMDSFSSGIGNFIKGFAGGFATGGTLRPGQWGIAGENGAEPIFAGARSLTVTPHEEAFGSRRGGTTIIQNISTPNADSFRYSQRQIARKAKTTLGG